MSKTLVAMDRATVRRHDVNGWYEIPRNPISKVGVFDYLGSTIGAPEPDKIYRVYRPAEELGHPDCIESFKLTPWINDHTFLGSEEGATPAENVGVHGVIGERVEFDPDFDGGTLFGNLKCFSESHAAMVDAGKIDLSLGYRCEYDWTPGVYNGEPYHAVQRTVRGNHVASVDEGRMGKGVVVLDAAIKITCDHKDFIPMSNKTKRVKIGGITMDAAVVNKGLDAIKRLPGLRKTGDEDEIAAAVAAIEAIAPLQEVLCTLSSGETVEAELLPDAGGDEDPGLAHERERVGEERADKEKGDKMTPDEEAAKKAADEEAAKKAADEEEAKKAADAEAATKATDAAVSAAIKHIAARDALAKRGSAIVGTFDHSGMTTAQVAHYIAKKGGLSVPTGDSAIPMVEGFLVGHEKSAAKNKTVVVGDSAATVTSADPFAAAANKQ